ncbi:MAG: 2-hydroxychromene-2-carboxylate isomerase [Myxococcota bacterium]|nr:2-hydroxychromene-2-carboxylate isomerase [Myxococcota bacterium]
MARLEFFYDCGSPWTYLAFHRIEEVARSAGAELVWKPILVGGVFNAVNDSVYEQRANPNPRKGKYWAKDLQDWARYEGIRIGWPSVFPVNSVGAMRGALVAQDAGCLPAWSRAVFEAYWGDDRDISRPEVLGELAKQVGLDAEDLLARIQTSDVKARLRANTEELIERGGFGSPTMFVDGSDMYFGNDRIPLVAAALGARV